MDLRQELAAERQVGTPAREQFIQFDDSVEQDTFGYGQLVEFRAQSTLQVFEHHRNQTRVGDPVSHECIAHILGPQRSQVHDASAANERPNEAHHKVNRVISGKNAEITNSGPEGIPSR